MKKVKIRMIIFSLAIPFTMHTSRIVFSCSYFSKCSYCGPACFGYVFFGLCCMSTQDVTVTKSVQTFRCLMGGFFLFGLGFLKRGARGKQHDCFKSWAKTVIAVSFDLHPLFQLRWRHTNSQFKSENGFSFLIAFYELHRNCLWSFKGF